MIREFGIFARSHTHTVPHTHTHTHARTHARTHTHTHTRLTALFPGLPGWAGTRKVKPIWILLEQETVSGCGISWAICKSAPHSRQITTPAPHHSVFTGRMPFLPPNQQRQSTEADQSVLNFSSTAVSRAADVRPSCLVRFTNRPFRHQRMYTKRLADSQS